MVERGLSQLRRVLRGHVVAVFSDNTTVVAYLRHQGGTLSPTLNEVARRILRWVEQEEISLLPQFVPGRNNVVADALSRPSHVVETEWMLHQEVFDSLHKRWPVVIDLFPSSLNHHCGVYFAPVSDPVAAGTDAMLQSWDYPSFSMLPQVLRKLRSSKGAVIALIAPFWPQREWFPDLLELLLEPPLPLPERWVGPSEAASRPSVPSEARRASSSCLETIRRFARASGFSSQVARRLGSARRSSSVANYQSKWSTYCRWCWEKGHSVSNPSVAKVANYLLWL